MTAAGGYVVTLTLSAALASCLLDPNGVLQSADGTGDGAVVVTPAPSPTPTPTPTPVQLASIVRLKAALANGQELPSAAMDVQVDTQLNTSHYASSAVFFKWDNSKLRWLGGRFAVGVTYPHSVAANGIAITNGDPAILKVNGLPAYSRSIDTGTLFTLPANQNEFEVQLVGTTAQKLQIIVDGVQANQPYDMTTPTVGSLKFVKVTLPPSAAPRTITLRWGPWSFMGLRVPSGQTLGSVPAIAVPASVVFIGDSITAGSVASTPWKTWAMQASYRLGVTEPINAGVGGSGYLARYPATTGYTFRERLDDAAKAINASTNPATFSGGAPDAIVVAGGINDCGVANEGKFTPAQVGTEALAYFQAIRAAAPETPIFVLGPFTDYNNPSYSATLFQCRDAIFASAAQVTYTYTIDVSNWVTPENRDQVFSGTLYGPHPLDSGHYIYGQRAAQAIAAILQGL